MKNLRSFALLAGTLAGCTVGPEYEAPPAPPEERYTPDPVEAGPHLPKLQAGRPIPAEWWTVFGSPAIDDLVKRALEESPTLAQARARLVQARELLAARTGATQVPQVDGVAGAVRQRIDPATVGFPQAPNPGTFNVFTLGIEASYTLDLFGGARRELEALSAEVDYEGFTMEAARLTLASNVVVAAIRLAAVEASIEASDAILDVRRRQARISADRLVAGGVSLLDVQKERKDLAQAESAAPALRAQRAQIGHLLAVLTGRSPAAAPPPSIRLGDLKIPDELPLRIPAELVRRRPDLRASEALLRRASAAVGVAEANLYPRLALSGALYTSRLEMNDLFGNGINVWSIGANLVQPLFRGGELSANRRAAVAAFEQAAAGHRQAVLQALQNVADVLRNLEADGRSFAALDEASTRAGEAHRTMDDRFTAGGVSQYALLDSDRIRRQAAADRLQGLANRFVDIAGLYQALGGGWIAEGATDEPR